jgi:RNA ligase (TIGR02306 family)
MSHLIVEVCRVEKVENHPNASKLKIATVKGWKTCIKYDPETDRCQFQEGDLCIYFPPDSVLNPKVYHDRLGIGNYLKPLPKNSDGTPSDLKRVAATRLRGIASFGVIVNLDESWGDDLNWAVGTNVAEHFGVTKYEPPPENVMGDAESPHIRFHTYTSIEHYANYPDSFNEGEEVVITEKIHGSNSRVGIVLDSDSEGNADWIWCAGSHSVRRKEFQRIQTRFKVSNLIEGGIVKDTPSVGDVLHDAKTNKFWKVEEIISPNEKSNEPEYKVQVQLVDKNHDYVQERSSFWFPLTENMKNLILDIRNNFSMDFETTNSIVVYGEIYGNGVQDMKYGLNARGFRAFDISVNNKYLDYDDQVNYFNKHNIETAPILYRGSFSVEKLSELTSGPTTLCSPELAGPFKGREGVVMKPVKEKHYCSILNGRKIVKSVSADYISRENGTEFH